jgi:hypothetical protein
MPISVAQAAAVVALRLQLRLISTVVLEAAIMLLAVQPV